MSRLPTVGGDSNAWGTVLNDFLGVAHNSDGTQKTSPDCILPAGWDSAWKAAKASAGSSRVSVAGIGDSITAGQGSTGIMVDSWWATLRAAILTANSSALGGDFYSHIYTLYGYPPASSPLVVDHSSGANVLNGGWDGCIFNLSGTPAMHCTPSYNVVGFDILYIDYAAGTWTYNVDGGSNTTVTTTGPGNAAGCIVKKASISGLGAGAHTLNINGTATINACNIIGVVAYAATTGICFANMGKAGMGLYTGTSGGNALADTTQFPPDRLHLYQGYQGTTVAPGSLTGLGFPSQPDLAIIAWGANDAPGGTTKAQFRDALYQLVASLRYGKADACSIAILATWAPDGTLAASTAVTDTDYTSAVSTVYRDLRAAMAEVASDMQCAFVDAYSLFGRTPVTNGWITSASDIHPTPAGHLKIANLLASIL